MDLSNVPGFISAKLASFSDARATAAIRADQLTAEISNLRDRWSGKVYRNADAHTDFPREIEQHLEEQNTVKASLAILLRIITDCREWLASLPSNVTLEQVTPEIETGQTLQAIRARIERLEDSVKALKKIPTPSPDIEQRVKNYIAGLTQPVIRGVAAGEQLSVTWPGAPSQYAAIPPSDWFVMAAFLEPDKFAARLLASIHKAAPPADRDDQIKDLEVEIEKLQRAEETLVVTTGASRISGRPPQVILGCKVVTVSRSKAAA